MISVTIKLRYVHISLKSFLQYRFLRGGGGGGWIGGLVVGGFVKLVHVVVTIILSYIIHHEPFCFGYMYFVVYLCNEVCV